MHVVSTVTDPGHVKVLYVLGTQRGGTTVTGRLAGALPGFEYAGELRKLWEVAIPEQRACGCGRAHEQCPVWSHVLPVVLRDDDAASVRASLRAACPEQYSTWRTFRSARSKVRPTSGAADHYTEAAKRLYEAFAVATNARVVIDSSKLPADALLLARSDVDAYFLHVVRDPRGFVQSLISRGGPSWFAHRRTSVVGSLRWMVRHGGALIVRNQVPASKSLVLSYEAMVRDPGAALARIAALVHEPPPPAEIVAAGRAQLPTAHTPSGAGRFRAETIEVIADERWLRSLAPVDILITNALTSPLRRRFGYRARHVRRQAVTESS